MTTDRNAGTVLLVDDDRDIAEIVMAVLDDEGFRVSILEDASPDAVRVAANRLEPDCVLLDGEGLGRYGRSWLDAAWLTERARRVPVVMFTAGKEDADEAEARISARAVAAGFSGIICKPFDLDVLVEAVDGAVGRAVPFDTSEAAESGRTAAMVARAEALGAIDVHASTRREWMSFRSTDATLMQVYYWQRDGVYYVLRHAESGGITENLGSFHDRDAALLLAVSVRRES
jgi:DNA-binding response OmpR family regulator